MLVPIGTRVVLRVPVTGARSAYPSGAVAVVVQLPTDATHSYRVRLPDGYETAVRRDQYGILADEKSIRPPAALDDRALRKHIVYVCVIGSQAYGLAHAESDVDRRGIYLPPAALHWSLFGVPEQIEDLEREECFWELQKFLVLAAKANPNILECLWTPLVERAEPIAEELLAMRDGALAWPEIEARRCELHAEFDAAFASTRLPDHPDYAAIDAFLVRARRSVS